MCELLADVACVVEGAPWFCAVDAPCVNAGVVTESLLGASGMLGAKWAAEVLTSESMGGFSETPTPPAAGARILTPSCEGECAGADSDGLQSGDAVFKRSVQTNAILVDELAKPSLPLQVDGCRSRSCSREHRGKRPVRQ